MASQALYRKWRSQEFETVIGSGACDPDPAQRAARRAHVARLPVHRAARHRQDQHRPHPGEGDQLPRTRTRRKRPVQRVRDLRRDHRGPPARPDRDRRGLEPRHRRDPRPAREDRLSAQRGALQGLHHRRSPHADEGGVQRAAEDARRAAAARDVRPGDDRAGPGARDGALALPAVRLPPHRHRRHRRSTWPTWCGARAGRPSRRRWRRSPGAAPAACATRSACSTSCCRTATRS